LVLEYHPDELNHVIDLIRKVACIWLRKVWPWIIVPLEIEANIFEVDVPWSGESKVVKLAA
jgi:hypothetical protein